MRLHVGSKGLRATLALACCLALGGGLSGCVSKAKYEKALSANQACQQRVAQQEQRLGQLHASLMDAHLAVTGQPASPDMTDEQLVAVLRSSISDRDAELARYQGEEEKALTYQLLAKYLFPSGSAQLTPQGRQALEKVATWLKESEANNIFVQGFTDDVPIGKNLKRKYVSNWELSAHRATSVVRFLVDQGVPEDRLIAVGYGEKHPEAEGGDELARQQNRRIEIKLNNGQFKEIIARLPESIPQDALIDVNRATVAELVVLPGMTPELARSVVDYRARAGRISSYDQLTQVRGFDSEKMQPIQSMITFGDQSRSFDSGQRTGTTDDSAIPAQDMNRSGTGDMDRSVTPATDTTDMQLREGTDTQMRNEGTDTQMRDDGGRSGGATTGSSGDQERTEKNIYLVPKEQTEKNPKNTYPDQNKRTDDVEGTEPGEANPF